LQISGIPQGETFVNKFISLVSLLAIAVLPVAAQNPETIRVHCGGPAYIDSTGQAWQADKDYIGGVTMSSNAAISGTADPELYRTERDFPGAVQGTMAYKFTLPNGAYHVNLYFAETDAAAHAVGARLFNVGVQNERFLTNLDIFAEAGPNAALIKGVETTVKDGTLVIGFTDLISTAVISAIEILPGASGPQMSLSFKYPDGTPVVGTLHYTVSSTALTFQGNVPLADGQASCALFANPSALGLSLEFTLNVNLTDTAGHLLWEMKLGLNPAQVNLAAVQSSNLAVTVQKQPNSAKAASQLGGGRT
jgi:hypothetical protein